MNNLFAFLLLASLVLLAIGLFSPKSSLFWYKKGQTRKKSTAIYGGATILFFILFGVTSDTKSVTASKGTVAKTEEPQKSKPSKQKKNDMPIEQKLAILDAGTFIDTTDLKVIRIKTLLNDLALMYNEPRDTIAEYTSKAQNVLHGKGIKESCLNILTGMRKGGKIDNTSYKEAVILYITIDDYSR